MCGAKGQRSFQYTYLMKLHATGLFLVLEYCNMRVVEESNVKFVNSAIFTVVKAYLLLGQRL